MTSPENFVHPRATGLPQDFVRSLVDAKLLPVDVAFRTQWLPYEISTSSGEREYGDHIAEKDILAATGHGSRTKYFEAYLSDDASPPACVTIRRGYSVRSLVRSSESDWHMFGDYYSIFIDSEVHLPWPPAIRAWHTIVLTALEMSGESRNWVDEFGIDAVYKKNTLGRNLQGLIGRTVIRDDILLGIIDESHKLSRPIPHDTVKVASKTYSAAELLMADNHFGRFGTQYAIWHEEALSSVERRTENLGYHQVDNDFYKRNGHSISLTQHQLHVLRKKYVAEGLGTAQEYDLLAQKDRRD